MMSWIDTAKLSMGSRIKRNSEHFSSFYHVILGLTKFDVKLPRLNFSHLHKWDTSIRTNMAWLSHSLEWNIRTDW